MLTSAFDAEDVLSATLSKMKLKALSTTALEAGGRWAIEFPAVDVVRLHIVLAGDCWLVVADGKPTYHMRAGDCFLVPHAKSLVMAADVSIKRKVPLHQLKWTAQDGVLNVVANSGGEFFAVGSAFQFDGHFREIALGRLPPVIHIPAHSEQAAVLRWSLDRFAAEVRNRQAGRALMLRHLAPIMLLQTLRGYLASAERDERNWLVALSEPRLSRAIAAMQSEHRRAWSLDELAKTAGLSRAGFALNFKRWIGVTPMEYLTQWRMQLACELLQEGGRVAEVASAVGYDSESAFSVAFTRVVQCRPGHYRKRGAPSVEAYGAGTTVDRQKLAGTKQPAHH